MEKQVVAKAHILVVDDEVSMREFLQIMLQRQGYKVNVADGAEKALDGLNKDFFDLIITDMAMPGLSGLDLLRKVKTVSPETEVIVITAFGTTETAIEAMKAGAFDYIMKPFNNEAIKITIDKCLQTTQLERENLLLKRQMKLENRFGDLIGTSPAMKGVYEMIQAVKNNKSHVLITGESGTGKELVAREIHYQGELAKKPFVTVNCGAIPENLMESELFGHVRGAFTGAVSHRIGLFKTAHGGTLFLDEIGELSLTMQVKMLRVLQTKIVRPVGSSEDLAVDVRIVAATNRDLEEAVKNGTFREDLFFRLNVIQIRLPSLRSRLEDLPSLTHFLAKKLSADMGKDIRRVSQEVLEMLSRYAFPGNIRELENILERSIALEKTSVLLPESLPDQIRNLSGAGSLTHGKALDAPLFDAAKGVDLEKYLDGIEKALLVRALELSSGVKTKAAKLLRLSFRSLRYRLEKHGLDIDRKNI